MELIRSLPLAISLNSRADPLTAFGLYYPAEALGETAVDFKRQDGFTFLDTDDNGKIRLLTAAAR
jgi:hypothetical protein